MWKQIFLKITEISRGLRRVSFSFRFYELQTVSQCECLSMVLREKARHIENCTGAVQLQKGMGGSPWPQDYTERTPECLGAHFQHTVLSKGIEEHGGRLAGIQCSEVWDTALLGWVRRGGT